MLVMQPKGKVLPSDVSGLSKAFLLINKFASVLIRLNQQDIEVDATDLGSLMQDQGLDNKSGIAVALNFKVISKNNWHHCKIKTNDNITIITATQGG